MPATIPLSPVPDTDMAHDLARKEFEHEMEREAFEKEMAGGGAIKRAPFESTGVGAAVGSTIGAIGGGLLTKNPAGVMAGGAIGAAVGEAAEQGLEVATRGLGAITPDESARNLTEQTLIGGAAELGGAAFRLVKPVRYVQPTALNPEQLARKQTFDKFKIPYLPHEITDTGFHKLLADLGESGMLNPNAYAELRKDQNALRKLAINGIADQVGVNVPSNQLAQNVLKVVKDSREAAERGIDVLYNTIRDDLKYTKTTRQVPTGQSVPNPTGLVGAGTEVSQMQTVEEITGGRWADISKTKQVFDSAKADYENAAQHLHQPDMLKAPWYQTISRASGLPEQAQWTDAHVFLKETRAEIRRVQDAKAAGSDTATMADLGVLNKIEMSLEGDLQHALATSVDPAHQRALTVWEIAQKENKGMSEAYRNDVVLSFIKKTREHGGEPAIKELVVSASPEDTLKILNATKADPELQGSLKRSFIQTGIERAGGQPGDELMFDPKKARTFLFGKDEFTARKTDMLVPAQAQKDIAAFLNATQQQLDAGKGGKVGTIFMAMKGAGLVMGGFGANAALHGDFTEAGIEAGAATTFLLGPGWLAGALQKPRVAALLIEGMRHSYSATKVGKVTQQLARLDETVARAIQVGINATGGIPAFRPEVAPKGELTTLPSAFPLEK